MGGQPQNVARFLLDETCHLTHLGLTTASALEIVTFTTTGTTAVFTTTYTAALTAVLTPIPSAHWREANAFTGVSA